MTLKTMKDLIMKGSVTINSAKRVKQETIKWCKWQLKNTNLKIEKMIWKNGKLVTDWIGTNQFSAGIIHGLAEFNNLTEEDLK